MASLFHSLVVIGAGVSASACGGVTNVSSGGTPDEAAGRNGAGGGAGRGSGGTLNTEAQLGIPLPDAGTLAQWNCTDQLGGCDSSDRHTVVCQSRNMTCGCAYTGILVPH